MRVFTRRLSFLPALTAQRGPAINQDCCKALGPRRPSQVVHRPIQHPLFRNITLAEAAAELAPDSVPVGRCIIRPSATRGPNALNISMKLPLSVWHIEIDEKGKVRGGWDRGSWSVVGGPRADAPLAMRNAVASPRPASPARALGCCAPADPQQREAGQPADH